MAARPLTPQAPAEPVIRVSVELVQIDATVTDSSGRHIADLRPEELEVYEDGKLQKITNFSYISSAPAGAGSPLPGVAPAQEAPPFARALKAREVRRTLALVADNLGIAASNIPRLKAALKNFVSRQMLPGDLVSILTTSGGMGALQQFTSDKRQLYAAIERVQWFPGGRVGASPFAAIADGDPAIAGAMESNNRRLALAAAQRDNLIATGSLESVRYVVEGMRRLPGRKALVLVSEGFVVPPEDLARLIDQANRAGVVVDTLDARGVVFTGLDAADDVALRHLYSASNERADKYKASQRSLQILARSTGGRFVAGDNDLGAALREAVADTDGYYLLGYQPRRSDFDAVNGAPVFHSIQVKVRRAGLTVRTRSGFYGAPELTLPALPNSRAEQMKAALYSPFQGDLNVRLSTLYSAGEKDAKSARRGALLRAILIIDAHDLTFEDQPDGKKKADLDVVGAVFGGDNKMVTSSDKTFTVNLGPEEWRQTVESGFVYQMYVPVAKSGPHQFRLALRDAGSGKTGSASAFVDIPDFNRRGLTLSSLELSMAGSPTDKIVRRFAAGSLLDFACDIFGQTVDKRTGQPKIEFEVRLFRGPERIFQSRAITMHAQDPGKQMILAGNVRLPGTLPRGEYAMEVVAYDRLAGADRQTATQWIDFSLIDSGTPVH
ncbi:MAG: VWA domain-containing protein [Acidobacteriota bacterium]